MIDEVVEVVVKIFLDYMEVGGDILKIEVIMDSNKVEEVNLLFC